MISSDEVAEQLSALMDDELPEAERELLYRRLQGEPALRRQWERMHLIRDGLRGELSSLADRDFSERVHRALASGQAVAPLKAAARRGGGRGWKSLGGVAVAASVAVLAVVGVQHLQPPAQSPAIVPQVATAPTTDSTGMRWDHETPEVQTQLTAYLVNHSEFSQATNFRGMMSYARVAGYDVQP